MPLGRRDGGWSVALVRAAVVAVASAAAASLASPLAREPPPPRARPVGKVERKGTSTSTAAPPLLGTLVDTHGTARLALDDDAPTAARFDALLHDPVLGSTRSIDPAVLRLVRTLATMHPGARIEVVSGFRSPKLNEALRKKGHHVASHSQHSLGHAMDMRFVLASPDGGVRAMDPRALAAEIRSIGWKGGVGIYLGADDRFVHADTGPLRTWYGQ